MPPRSSAMSFRGPARQRGAIGIVVGLSLMAFVGFLGLVIDLGHMYVVRSELQNAADSCALAAARELTGDAAAVTRAEAAGIAVGGRNNSDFQDTAVQITPADISFGERLSPNSTYLTRTGGADPIRVRYARCVLTRGSIGMWFMGILGFGSQTVRAQAVATLAPAQTMCALPMGLCSKGPATGNPPYGLVKRSWVQGRFDSQNSATGNFNWIDFTPGEGGGASELAGQVEGPGVCNLVAKGTQVGQTGILQSLEKSWNTRFGVYKGGGGCDGQAQSSPPDYTGYVYTDPVASPDPYPDFLTRRTQNAAAQVNLPGYQMCTAPQHKQYGSDRRIATVPIVDCSLWAGSTPQTIPVQDWACILMLNVIEKPSDSVKMEYLGLAGDPTSPCASSGLAGGASSVGPKVPVLVQ